MRARRPKPLRLKGYSYDNGETYFGRQAIQIVTSGVGLNDAKRVQAWLKQAIAWLEAGKEE